MKDGYRLRSHYSYSTKLHFPIRGTIQRHNFKPTLFPTSNPNFWTTISHALGQELLRTRVADPATGIEGQRKFYLKSRRLWRIHTVKPNVDEIPQFKITLCNKVLLHLTVFSTLFHNNQRQSITTPRRSFPAAKNSIRVTDFRNTFRLTPTDTESAAHNSRKSLLGLETFDRELGIYTTRIPKIRFDLRHEATNIEFCLIQKQLRTLRWSPPRLLGDNMLHKNAETDY